MPLLEHATQRVPAQETARCHLCHSRQVVTATTACLPVRLVSSDAQPIDGTVQFIVCTDCETIQKLTNANWTRTTAAIYDAYHINHQSPGTEPAIFGSRYGDGPRSYILQRCLQETVALPEHGRLLDIGCSDGNFFKCFHPLRPGWQLHGAEISDQWQETVLSLPGVERFFVGRNTDYGTRYDIITLSHVLEHIPDPIAFLQTLKRFLTPGGRVLLATPDIRQNPIDLVIADHCTHFDVVTLRWALQQAGFSIELLAPDLLPKELVAIIHSDSAAGQTPLQHTVGSNSPDLCRHYFTLLNAVRDAARRARVSNDNFGIMGSSIAAVWLAHELDRNIAFFVDEDESRVGGTLLDRPILDFAGVPPGATVFIPMSVAVAERIIERAKALPIQFSYLDWNQLEPEPQG